ncbi:Uncharacterized protein Fot_20986 [Forsythia ovata]|uniref:Uncharacterized protein n=1 Tax=Forsythia ovata TaxID=205694 RepID=A0ABD1UTJ6_9LAMI
MGLERLMGSLKSKVMRCVKMKKAYEKIEKSESMRIEMRSRKAQRIRTCPNVINHLVTAQNAKRWSEGKVHFQISIEILRMRLEKFQIRNYKVKDSITWLRNLTGVEYFQ